MKPSWLLFLINIFANPPFIYFLSFFFSKDEAGSSFVKLIYIVFGIIGPIAVSILQVVNSTTQDVANVLRWVFYPVPIFSLTFGYISIANREIIRAVQKLTEDPPTWGKDVAGPALAFLISSIVFYWLMVICFEMRVFSCKRRRPNQNEFQSTLKGTNNLD